MEYELITAEGILSIEVQQQITDIEKQVKALDEQKKRIRELLLSEMEAKGIKKLDNDFFSVTYVAPTYKETFDSKKFKVDYEDLYNKYVKISDVKSQIKVSLK